MLAETDVRQFHYVFTVTCKAVWVSTRQTMYQPDLIHVRSPSKNSPVRPWSKIGADMARTAWGFCW
jgi:hypothetical protein